MLYISSPFTHENDATQKRRFEIAARASARLMAAGIPVIPPLSIMLAAEEQGLIMSHAGFLKLDLQILRRCDEMVILALPEWQKSIGVKQEIFEALKLKKPITVVEENDIELLPRVKNSAIRYQESRILKCVDDIDCI
ncbi:MAG: DUF1937 family protein [Thermoguttaceae bacterium]